MMTQTVLKINKARSVISCGVFTRTRNISGRLDENQEKWVCVRVGLGFREGL
ncbi:hypothetical protein ACFL54_07830 [Planctomycetota bacterium]